MIVNIAISKTEVQKLVIDEFKRKFPQCQIELNPEATSYSERYGEIIIKAELKQAEMTFEDQEKTA